MNIVDMVRTWWQRRQREQLLKRRLAEFDSSPEKHTHSPLIRSLIASPVWNENVREPGQPRIVSISQPSKARGRDYVLDLLQIERGLRFGALPSAWRGIQAALHDDLLRSVYAEEYQRIAHELQASDADVPIQDAPPLEHVQAQGHALISDGLRTLKKKEATRPGGST